MCVQLPHAAKVTRLHTFAYGEVVCGSFQDFNGSSSTASSANVRGFFLHSACYRVLLPLMKPVHFIRIFFFFFALDSYGI